MQRSIRVVILLTTLTLLLTFLGYLVAGTIGGVVSLVVSLIIGAGVYCFSDRITLGMAGATEVAPEEAPELHGIVERLARRAGVPKPRVCVLESSSANAFATGRDPDHASLVVTMGIVNALDRDELAAVIAHELAHIRNGDTLTAAIVATVAGAVTSLANVADWPPFGGVRHSDDDVGLDQPHPARIGSGLALIVLAPLGAALVRLAGSREREFAADAAGSQILGDPLPLASALEKLDAVSRRRPLETNPALAHQFIVQPLFEGRLARLFSTHPPIGERVARLHAIALHDPAVSFVAARDR